MFIKSHNGYVDLSLVSRTQTLQTGGPRLHGHSSPPGTATRFLDPAGPEIGIGGGGVDLERLTSPAVAASGPPALAVFVQVEQADHRPTADDVQAQSAAIVAYRICRGGGEPVFLGTEPSGVMHFGLAGGKLLDVATGCLHDGADGARQAVLHAAQREWDRDHPAEIVEIETVEHKAEVVDMPKPTGGRRHAR